ncbi:MAG: dual specificity protein phosphatase family protein [Methanomassiliicoccales archaeon]|nr:dual specificity protein phosphatase family protein [Methanomassiliicoccales archaeon]
MDWIDDFVAVGGWMDAISVHRRKEEGVELIIDARTLFDRGRDLKHTPRIEQLLRAGDMLVALSDLDAKVLIRCRKGKDRTLFLAMIYVSKKYGLSYRDAYARVKEKRPRIAYYWDWVEMLGSGKN